MFKNVDQVHGRFLQYAVFKVVLGRLDSPPSVFSSYKYIGN